MLPDTVGIVLMGGKSTRMGQDKSLLTINGKNFHEIAFEKLKTHCNDVLYAINQEQTVRRPSIIDIYQDYGPISGIYTALSTLKKNILVLAADMVHISDTEILQLLKHKEQSSATAFYDFENERWEPLLSFWSIDVLPLLQTYLDKSEKSIHTFLKQINAHKVPLTSPNAFVNINTKDAYKRLIFNDSVNTKKANRS